MRDYGTRRVELAWIAPFRRYAPAALVLCTVLLLVALFALPRFGLSAGWTAALSRLLLALVFMALAVLAAFLAVGASQAESAARSEIETASELYDLTERLNTTLRSIGDGVISTDVDGVVTLINDVASQLTGWPASKAVGMRASELFRVIEENKPRKPEDHPTQLVLSLGKKVREDRRALLRARDGAEHPIAYNASPILDADGWMMGTVIVFHDVTNLRSFERQREQLIRELSLTNEKLQQEVTKREEARRAALSLMQDAQLAQSALRESEERLRVLFEGIDDCLLVHDPEGRILDCNMAACSRLGYARKDLLALNLRDVTSEQRGDPTPRRLVTRAGVAIAVDVHTSVITYQGRSAFLTVARDVTELKKAQDELRLSNEQLRESNEALEEYARVASHDLQEPLRKIESFAQVLVEDYGGRLDQQARNYLDIMVDAARRMRRLIRDVLAFSRAGTAEKPFAPVDLNRVLAVVKDNLSARIQETSAEVAVRQLPTVFADETQMIQLFQNLVGNGLKFNDKPKPAVEVYADGENHEAWTLAVRDNGIGMSAEETRVIFAPFKRLHSQERYEGTGIGLAICRRIVARHGGSIEVASAPGQGTTFRLALPKAPAAGEKHRSDKDRTARHHQQGEPS